MIDYLDLTLKKVQKFYNKNNQIKEHLNALFFIKKYFKNKKFDFNGHKIYYNTKNNNKKYMKKLTIISLLIAISGVSLANDYQVRYFVDKDYIQFKTKPTTPVDPTPEPAQPECLYDYPNSYWLAGRNNAYDILHVYFKGEQIHNGKGFGLTSVVKDGVTYTRSTFAEQQGDYSRYYICKQPN